MRTKEIFPRMPLPRFAALIYLLSLPPATGFYETANFGLIFKG